MTAWIAQRGTRVAVIEADDEASARVLAVDLLTSAASRIAWGSWPEGATIRPATAEEVARWDRAQEQLAAVASMRKGMKKDQLEL
jgi:hypothetical protein